MNNSNLYLKDQLNNFKSSKIYYKLLNLLKIDSSDNFAEELLNIISIKQYTKNTILFKENQITNLKLYIIIQGKVGVCKFIESKYINIKQKININKVKLGYFLKELSKDDIFGELALISDENKRTASVYTIDDSIFIEIEKNNFKNKLKIHLQNIYDIKKKILKIAFKNINNYFVSNIIHRLKKKKFKRKNIIINKNEVVKKLYIIYNGLWEVYDDIKNTSISNKFIYINELSNYQIFGEESLFIKNSTSKYYFKVKSQSVTIYTINIEKLDFFPEIKTYLRNQLKNLFNFRNKFKEQKKKKFVWNLIKINNSHLVNKSKTKNFEKIKKFFKNKNKYLNIKFLENVKINTKKNIGYSKIIKKNLSSNNYKININRINKLVWIDNNTKYNKFNNKNRSIG